MSSWESRSSRDQKDGYIKMFVIEQIVILQVEVAVLNPWSDLVFM
jgi:hypothetical protein